MGYIEKILMTIIFVYVLSVDCTFLFGILNMLIGSEFGENDRDYISGKTLCKNAWNPIYAIKRVIKDNLDAANNERGS